MNQTVLIDSFGWVEYFTNGPLAEKYARHILAATSDTTITPTIVLYEVYKRIKKQADEKTAIDFQNYVAVHTKVIPLTELVAVKAADISLDKRLAMADSIVKATADLYNAKIITSDPDFKGMEGVVYIK